jgi:hypothetical protein
VMSSAEVGLMPKVRIAASRTTRGIIAVEDAPAGGTSRGFGEVATVCDLATRRGGIVKGPSTVLRSDDGFLENRFAT